MKDKDSDKTKGQLIRELEAMRRRIAGLEASASESQFMERDRSGEVQGLFVQGPVVIFRWRAEAGWPVEYVSPNLESQFGYKPVYFTGGGISYRDIIHPEDLPHISEELERCDGNGKEYLRQEYRIRSQDCSYRWVHDYTVLVRDSTGITTHYLGYITDITESKQAEEAVRESEAKYRFLTENMSDIVFTIDLNMKTTYVSPSVERILGFTPEERMSQHPQEQFTPASYKLAAETLQRELEKEKATGKVANELFTLELEYYHKNGSVIITEVTAHAIRDEQGKPVGVYGLCRDITERKQALEQLKESEEKYRLLADNAADVIWTMDIDNPTQLIYISPSVKQLLGYSIEEAKSKKMEEIFTDTSFKHAMLVYAEEMAKKDGFTTEGAVGSRTIEFELKRADGSTVPVDINYSLIRGPDDQPVQMLAVARDITERKKALEQLRQIEERYRSVFENTGTATIIVEEDTTISLANEEFARLSGYLREEVEGKKRWTEFVAKEDLDRMIGYHRSRRTKVNSVPRNYEFRFIDRGGNIKHILLTVAVIPGTVKSVASLVDITGRKEIEDALRESEGQYRSLINLGGEVGEAVVMLQDTDQGEGIQVFVSDRWLHITGYSRKELIGTSFFNLVHPDSREASLERHRRKMRGEVIPGLFEMLVIGKDGAEVPVELTSAYTTYRGGHADVIYARDITERKKMEEALEQERALFVSGPTIVFKWLAAEGWPIDYVSPNVYGLLGYTAAELLDGKHLFKDVLHPGDITRIAEANKAAERRKGQRILVGEYRLRDKSGKIKWVHEHTTLIRDDEGVVRYHHGYVTDITEQKKAEAERQELERKAQVTSRLASIGEMASGIAHEVNNPLTSVVGFSELLMEKDLPEDLRKDVEIIHSGAERVAGIVKGLLTFARQHKPEQTYTGINEIIESTLALRKYALETSGIEVITLLDNELPWTVADAGQLQQVFLNIIVNAEAEMKKAHGRGRLTIRTEQAGNRIRISFADDGPGIAGENLERIFDPFFTTKEVGEGTGLGLSLAHGIVAEHNGALYAESEEGKGATFFVELPIVMEGEKKIERVEAVESAGKAVGGRILVVDDEPAILAFLKKVLGGEGYDVETVGNGREALGMIKEQRYSLIISDVKMPGLSGAELYDELGGIDPALQKRVIFITGDVIGPVTREFLERIRVLYFTKPFDITGLKKEVNRVIVSAG